VQELPPASDDPLLPEEPVTNVADPVPAPETLPAEPPPAADSIQPGA